MDVDAVYRFAWARGLASLQRTDWRALLHAAVERRLGREPTILDMHFSTTQGDLGTMSTSLVLTLDGQEHCFEGVRQNTVCQAIRCVSWIALVELGVRGVLEMPPECMA